MKIIFLLFLLNVVIFANIATISSFKGQVSILRADKVLKGKVNFQLLEKDIVKTNRKSRVKIHFNDNTYITIGQNAVLDIANYTYDKRNPQLSKSNFQFLQGAFKVLTGIIAKTARKRFKLKTRTATMGVRGTIIIGNQKEIACLGGAIEVSSKNKTVFVSSGMITQTVYDQAPSTPKKYNYEQIKNIYSDMGIGMKNSNNRYNNQPKDISKMATGISEIAKKGIKPSNISTNKQNTLNQQTLASDIEHQVVKNLDTPNITPVNASALKQEILQNLNTTPVITKESIMKEIKLQ